MAIAKSGLLRGLKGKTAGLVMSQTKQGTVVREYKDSITNPKTPAQQANRAVFKAAVSTASAFNDLISKMYGTIRMPAYSKVVSMIMQNIGGKATRSFKNGILKPVPAMYNQVGINNDDVGLNIFNLKYAEFVSNNRFTLGEKLHTSVSGLTVYFGMDYAIDQIQMFLVGLNSVYTVEQNIEFDRIGGVDGAEKNLGYYSSAEECGLAWNYIYKYTLESAGYHPISILLTEASKPDLYKNDIYEANGINALGNYIYFTLLVCSSVGEGAVSKKGCLFLSSGNFYRRINEEQSV